MEPRYSQPYDSVYSLVAHLHTAFVSQWSYCTFRLHDTTYQLSYPASFEPFSSFYNHYCSVSLLRNQWYQDSSGKTSGQNPHGAVNQNSISIHQRLHRHTSCLWNLCRTMQQLKSRHYLYEED